MPTTTAVDVTITQRFTGLEHAIDNTLLFAIDFTYRGEPRVIYAKYEQVNFTGSIENRMAPHILRQAYTTGDIQPGDTIVEATSGNTGISFSVLPFAHPLSKCLPWEEQLWDS